MEVPVTIIGAFRRVVAGHTVNSGIQLVHRSKPFGLCCHRGEVRCRRDLIVLYTAPHTGGDLTPVAENGHALRHEGS